MASAEDVAEIAEGRAARSLVAILTLARPEKRNALNDATVLGLEAFFATLPTA